MFHVNIILLSFDSFNHIFLNTKPLYNTKYGIWLIIKHCKQYFSPIFLNGIAIFSVNKGSKTTLR